MRRAPIAAASLVVMAIALIGCASNEPTGSAPIVSAEPVVESTSPTPTLDPVVIGPANMPPAAFGGDCAAALSVDDISEVLGMDVVDPARSFSDEAMTNVGGLECEWRGPDGDAVILAVVPRAGLDGAVFPEDLAPRFFEECTGGSYCAWQGGDDTAWVGLTFTTPEGATLDDVEAGGNALGQRVLGNYASAGDDPWIRDTAGWFPALDCAQVGNAIGAQLGVPITGQISGWDADRPPTGHVMALEGSRQASCYLRPDGDTAFSMTIWPGLGETLSVDGATETDFGVPGVTVYEGGLEDYRGRAFVLTDGVNRIDYWMHTDDAEAKRKVAVAVAAAAASDFQ